MNADVMVEPSLVPGPHTVFMCGDDAGAKAEVSALSVSFGWPAGSVMDLGDVTAARGMERYLLHWLRMMGATGTAHFNVGVSVAAS